MIEPRYARCGALYAYTYFTLDRHQPTANRLESLGRSWVGGRDGKRQVLVSRSRSRVSVCIKLLTAFDFCGLYPLILRFQSRDSILPDHVMGGRLDFAQELARRCRTIEVDGRAKLMGGSLSKTAPHCDLPCLATQAVAGPRQFPQLHFSHGAKFCAYLASEFRLSVWPGWPRRPPRKASLHFSRARCCCEPVPAPASYEDAAMDFDIHELLTLTCGGLTLAAYAATVLASFVY